MLFAHARRLALVLAAVLAAGGAQAGSVTVFAAASLKSALDSIAAGFEQQTGHEVTLAFAGSSALARQIEHGAPADVFIPANPQWMDHLEAAGRIDPESRFVLAGNRLVLIAHGAGAAPVELSPELDLAAMLDGRPLAMALVDAVPAGIYGKAALSSLGLWQAVAGQVAQASNVRAALALVTAGEAPLGIVYATDAAAGTGVSVIATFPPATHPPITYPAAAVAPGANPQTTQFLAYLRSEEARAILAAQGFLVQAE
ncbi:molybdate ABC transporter substrate-binding protein (plasmid) [Roseobacteraceae bacterium NS-SX3]